MAENRLEAALEDCITRLAEGGSLADCVRRYPDLANDLIPLLESGLIVRRIQVSDSEVADSQERVAARFEDALSRAAGTQIRWWRNLSLIAAVFVMLLFANVVIAQNSIPGDWNYGIKRLSETALLVLSGNNAEQRSRIAARRLEEVRLLLAMNREAEIELEGRVIEIRLTGFLIAGLNFEIEASPEILTLLRANDRVLLLARSTSEGHLLALSVEIIGGDARDPQISSTVTATATFTVTDIVPPATNTAERFTATIRPSATPTATLSPTLTDTVTASPTQTATVTPAPTLTDTPVECVLSIPGDWIAYTIQGGDTLSALATRAGISLDRLATANCIEDPSIVSVGQTIYLPAPESTTIEDNTATATPFREDVRPTDESVATRPPVRPSATATRGR